MSNPYQEAERQVDDVLTTAMVLLPEDPFEEAHHYIDHGEYELALDTIAATLAQAGKRANRELYTKFVSLGKQMDFEESNWEAIRPLP